MKLLVDAQLPRRIVDLFNDAGCDAIHTLDLPDGNRTSDSAIIEFANNEGRIIVTKDADFINSFILTGRPEKLLLISTGNISNKELKALLMPNISAIRDEFVTNRLIELTRTSLIIHT